VAGFTHLLAWFHIYPPQFYGRAASYFLTGPFNALPTSVPPLLMVVYILYKMVFPWRRRQSWWSAKQQVWIAPFGHISFFIVYVADMMTSLNKITASMVESVCYITSGDFFVDHRKDAPPIESHVSPHCGPTTITARYITPMILILPLCWRMMQCLRQYYETQQRWPYVANAIKYGLSSSVVLFGIFNPFYLTHDIVPRSEVLPYQVIWIIAFLISTLYSCEYSRVAGYVMQFIW